MTNENKNEGQTLDWDSAIENDGKSGKKFETLPVKNPDGSLIPYRFGVKNMEKSTSSKLRCPMAKLKIGIFADADADYANELIEINENLCLHTTCEWKISEFFRAISEKKHGEKIKPNWPNVPGAIGRCYLAIEKFTKRDNTEGTSNGISVFLDPVVPKEQPEPETAKSKFD